jgi:hypothetical protein
MQPSMEVVRAFDDISGVITISSPPYTIDSASLFVFLGPYSVLSVADVCTVVDAAEGCRNTHPDNEGAFFEALISFSHFDSFFQRVEIVCSTPDAFHFFIMRKV